jgi:hypothetical protein
VRAALGSVDLLLLVGTAVDKGPSNGTGVPLVLEVNGRLVVQEDESLGVGADETLAVTGVDLATREAAKFSPLQTE